MALHIPLLFLGLVVLVAGAECLVRGGSSLARHLGLTPLIIGLTVVAFGTSAPEMIVSVGGSLQGQDDIAVANVVGSNIFNVGFILAVCALTCPIVIRLGVLKVDAPLVFGLSLMAVWIIRAGALSRFTGIVLLVLLAGYTWWGIRLARKQMTQEIKNEFEAGILHPTRSFKMDGVLIVAGLLLLVSGSKLLLHASMSIARFFDVPEAVIGLTIVAAGTSMPELATSFMAALRKQPDIAVGNILGSNIFNLLGILGLSAAVKPLRPIAIMDSDLWIMACFALAMLPLFWTGRILQRWEGGLLLAGYFGYLWLRWP